MKVLERQQFDFRLWLQGEFTARCKKNPRYSLRAFAKALDLDSSTVSQILAGKRRVSVSVRRTIIDQLSPAPAVREALIHPELRPNESAFHQLALDAFAVISDWYHYAILELTFVQGFRNDPAWIARKLGITVTEVKTAIERLTRLELAEEVGGKLVKTDGLLTNYSEGVTTPALRELQKQVLAKALDAVENTPTQEKDITSMTMAIDVAKIPEAKKLIKNFRRNLCQFLEDGNRGQVYHLGVQLYPVSKKE